MARAQPKGSWSARDPAFVSLFQANNLQQVVKTPWQSGEYPHFDTVWPPFEESWLFPWIGCYRCSPSQCNPSIKFTETHLHVHAWVLRHWGPGSGRCRKSYYSHFYSAVPQFESSRKEHMKIIPIDVFETTVTPEKEGWPSLGHK